MNKNNLLVKAVILMVFILVFQNTHAQKDCIITGYIKDFDTKIGLSGANVLLKPTKLGDATNDKGKFRIVGIVPGSYTLSVSYIGYHSQ